ncbi:MAG: hypothetical protein D4R79_06725 [Comamonadaceae bacterium]|nr:MAG: hypothetical protein D4R79_06725 [Comamonadaceae bacterium]
MTNANITRTEAVANENTAKNVALFLAAPFIGLVYAVLLPFVGMAMLLVTGTKALVAAGALAYAGRLVKNVALLVAAPFIGLVYAVTFPFVGIAMLLWTAVEALTATVAKIEVPALMRATPAYAA